MYKNIFLQTKQTVQELCIKANIQKNDILVVGCSSSEIVGSKIGSNSSPETAKAVFDALYEYSKEKEFFLAIQCCEHLNRAIITERDTLQIAETVNVVPQPKAGGSLAAYAYTKFKNPIVLEEIKADAGIDIGLTLIGMHLKKVAVPVRLENNKIGEALVVAARTRPKFIGGSRAVYDEDKM